MSDQELQSKENNVEKFDDATQRSRTEPLALGVRIALILVGWLVLLVGIAGLVLPGLQGILTILLGAAILSAVSDRVHAWTNKALGRWPTLTVKLDALRHRLLVKLTRRK